MTTDLILGTAGHIDHGKTSLVKALTGVDTDRLPEEKRRGITIELGFAELTLGDVRLGIVDVPGHERFVRNMLAGATGIDLALLVVAADDSVKPQTREHLEILKLLGLETGVIALTKCDLPEPDWLALVEEDVRELVADTFLRDAPLVRTSATTGLGLDALRATLSAAAQQAARSPRRSAGGPFRLAIDRTFTVAGHGTVVTGSITSGRVCVGDELAIEPGGLRVRVRGLQNHDRPVDEVHRGQRAAINLVGVHHDEIGRGQELCSPGHLVPSKLLSVELRLIDSAHRPLRNRARVQLHLGTAELPATVALLDCDELRPGEQGYAQLFVSQPVVATWSQAFVVRQATPAVTLGGGRVLDPAALKLRRRETDRVSRLATLASADPVQRASGALYFAGIRQWQPRDLARTAGVDEQAAATALTQRGDLVEVTLTPSRTVKLHQGVVEELQQRLEETLRKLHAQAPLATMVERSRLVRRFDYLQNQPLVEALLAQMQSDGRVRLTDRGVALAGCGPQLSKHEQRLYETILEAYRSAGCQPPTVEELQAGAQRNQASVPQLVELGVTDGNLVRISPEFFLHADVERQLRATLRERLAAGGLTLSQIRESLGTTRKYAVPLCEYLDRIGFTRREGDLRLLAAP
jgi:selenocysteine-specific elongation factor